MNKLIAIGSILVSVLLLSAGCSVTKVEYEKNDKGEVSYRLYRNDHWLKTESTGIKGGMTNEGKFEFAAEGMKSSPSEEFNRTMQTYTTAFVQLAQIAAAAYNPSASQAVATAAKTTAAKKTTTAKKPAATAKKTTTAKKPAVPATANTSMKVTAAEKKLIEAYRGASGDLKKVSLKVLKGEYGDAAIKLLDTVGGGIEAGADGIGGALGNLLGGLLGGK